MSVSSGIPYGECIVCIITDSVKIIEWRGGHVTQCVDDVEEMGVLDEKGIFYISVKSKSNCLINVA